MRSRSLKIFSDMLPPDQLQTQAPEETDSGKNPLTLSGSADYLAICSLVLNAVGIEHVLNPGSATLTVSAQYSEAARYHLGQYFKENTGWPERPVPAPMPLAGEHPPTLLMIGGLAVFYLVTGPWQEQSFWFRAGAIDSRAILEQREWWRLLTALTLHADQVHLLGNCVIGGFLVHMLCKTIGSGLGWFALFFTGALGNLLNILLRDQAHHSVGFSTSIFAAVGIFSGLRVLSGNKNRLREILLPIGAGGGLLAMLGTEGERTDLGAHFFGFACGIGFGLLVHWFDPQKLRNNNALQRTLFLLSLLAVLLSWIFSRQ